MMENEDLYNDVMFNVERIAAILNVSNLAEANICTLNRLIAEQLLKISPNKCSGTEGFTLGVMDKYSQARMGDM